MADPVSPILTGVLARCASKIRLAAYRRGLDQSDLDDLIQEVRIRLWRALGTSEKIEAVPPSYVYQTASSAAVDLIRSRRRNDRLEPIDEGTAGAVLEARDSIDQMEQRADIAGAVWTAVGALAADRRVAVRMYLNGYNHTEIAEMSGWTEGRARNLLYRGLNDLRQALGSGVPAGGGEPR